MREVPFGLSEGACSGHPSQGMARLQKRALFTFLECHSLRKAGSGLVAARYEADTAAGRESDGSVQAGRTGAPEWFELPRIIRIGLEPVNCSGRLPIALFPIVDESAIWLKMGAPITSLYEGREGIHHLGG